MAKKTKSAKTQFASMIKSERYRLELTLQQIQNVCGIHRGYLWMVENEKRGIPTVETIMKIEKGMGIKCGVLVKKAVELLKSEVYRK